MNKEAIEKIKIVIDMIRCPHKEDVDNCGDCKRTSLLNQALAKLRKAPEQPPASDFTKECRELRKKGATAEQLEYARRLDEACDRFDRSEASRKELLTACVRGLNRLLELGQRDSMDTLKILKAAIKSNKEIKK